MSQIPLEAENEFYAAMEREDAEQLEREARAAASARLNALALQLKREFSTAESSRRLIEERWLEDLMQYRGQYPADVMERLKKFKRSQVYYRMTTNKVDMMVARLMDLLFPARSKNWAIQPTPDPEIPGELVEQSPEFMQAVQEVMAEQMQLLQAQNAVPDDLAMRKMQQLAMQEAMRRIDLDTIKLRIAKACADKMEQVIDDQLKESSAGGEFRPSWQQHCKAVIFSSCLLGMGVLKGPLVERRELRKRRPVSDASGRVVWDEQVMGEEIRPYYEAVPVWEVYPDPGALEPRQLRYVWQVHLKTDKDLWDLMTFPGFDASAIEGYLKEHENGDASLTTYESQKRNLNDANGNLGAVMDKRFRVYERWGYLTGQELRDAGCEVGDADLYHVFPSCVWMLGDTIIKASVNPLEGVDIPFFFYPYQRDETSFWPEGIAYRLRSPQAGINAAVRAAQDNTAWSSGPLFGVNMQALAEGEDPLDISSSRVLLFDKAGVNINQALSVAVVPSCIQENLTQVKFWQECADEISTPRFNAGDGRVSGAGETASGLSMLMGASNILLKDRVKDFDEYVSAPFIRAMYRFNMQWNPREEIKGDYEVVATGSQSLIAKEVRAQQVPGIISLMANPLFASRIKEDELLKVTLEQTDLPAERILRTEKEAQEHQHQQMLMQALAQAEANVQALTAELGRQGLSPEQVQQQLMLALAQSQQQAAQAQSEQPMEGTAP